MFLIDKLPARIYIGIRGEENVNRVQFDVSAWDALYPDGIYDITYTLPGSDESYPELISHVLHENGVLTWIPSENVLSSQDYGTVVIHCVTADTEKRSPMVQYYVSRSHAAAGPAPGPVADWIREANAKLSEADESIGRTNAAEDLRETAETARETAEGLRVSAETSRNTAEGLRASAETSRNSAEGLRDSAETDRREAEALRVAAEAVRMGFKPMGAYNPANENKYGEWYTHEGGSYGYIYPTPCTGVPLTDTSHWQQIAAKGDRVELTGPWDELTTYSYYQSAEFYGSSYIYINSTPSAGHTPLDTNYWILWAARGEQFVDTTNLTWQGVRDVVRQGLGSKVFPVGSVLRTTHTTYGDILWRVMAHNHDVNKNAPELLTMRLEMISCIHGRQADEPELLWANTSAEALPAGTYNFTLLKADNQGQTREDGTYQFTTEQAIPVGGGFRHSQVGQWMVSYAPANIIGNYLTTYDASGIVIESNLSVTAGSGGTALGTASRNWADTVNIIGRFNSTQRNAYGSNHAGESGVRQWLNSDLGANLWWVKKTPFDLKPSYANQPGFLAGFDADFLDALVTVDNICARNTIYEEGGTLGGSYVTADKMFRPSMTELGLGVNNAIAEGAVLDYYEGTTALERIKFDIASPATARYWWLRSPLPSHANFVRAIDPDGSRGGNDALYGEGVAPDCVIG